MLLTITLVLVAMFALAAFELWLFWWLDERDQRRRGLAQATARPDRARRKPVPKYRSQRRAGRKRKCESCCPDASRRRSPGRRDAPGVHASADMGVFADG
jgi:hypothetical protein